MFAYSPFGRRRGDVPTDVLTDYRFSRRRAILQMPVLIAAFLRHMGSFRHRGWRVAFNHYSTFPLAWVVPRRQRWFFVQETDWVVVNAGRYRDAVKRFVLAHWRRGRLLTANPYLTQAMRDERLVVDAQVHIWADAAFAGRQDKARKFDIVTVLRTGAHKRADLGREMIARCRRSHPELRLAVITPDQGLFAEVADEVAYCVLRPRLEEMRHLYERSRLFVLLSEHEGFASRRSRPWARVACRSAATQAACAPIWSTNWRATSCPWNPRSRKSWIGPGP